jgi:YfiH family protein
MIPKPLMAELSTSKCVVHGFFGRRGGCSDGAYASLNCSGYLGDDPKNVLKNLQLVKDSLKIHDMVTLRQRGSNRCIYADSFGVSGSEADALVTDIPGIAIGILSADCLPLLFLDEESMVIGAAHAGWRGALSGILESTMEAMLKLGARLSRLVVAFGPCIRRQSYEIKDDFRKNFPDDEDCFYQINSEMHFDLPQYCRKRLLGIGLEESHMADAAAVDTFVENADYFSHRAARGGICGRNISVIGIRLLSKQRYFEEFIGAYGAQDRSVHVVHAEPSTEATQKLPKERMF